VASARAQIACWHQRDCIGQCFVGHGGPVHPVARLARLPRNVFDLPIALILKDEGQPVADLVS
jgi:hypothetical protein